MGAQGPLLPGRLQGLGAPGWQGATGTGRARSLCTRTRSQGGDAAAGRARAPWPGNLSLGAGRGLDDCAGALRPTPSSQSAHPVSWLTSYGPQRLGLGQINLSDRGQTEAAADAA